MNTQNRPGEKGYETPKTSTVFTQATHAKESCFLLYFRNLGIYPQQPPQPTNPSI
jgi:hypothetical protein